MITIQELTPSEVQRDMVLSTISGLVDIVQAHMDKQVQTRGYDSLLSACSYATSQNLPFQTEAQACVMWRDAVWMQCYSILAQVQQGTMAVPTSTELLDMLPVLDWHVER